MTLHRLEFIKLFILGFMKYCFFILIIFSLSSCDEINKRNEITHLVKKWDGREIIFPFHPIFTIQGRDTVDFSHENADYKILTYIDSVGCISCKLQLPRWKEFISEIDSLTNGKTPFLFFFGSKNMKELTYTMRCNDFTYPVCIDLLDQLNRKNNFPTKMMFQTFLLNKKNEVLIIGNPIHNPKIKDLYYQKILGNEKQSAINILTEIDVDKTKINLGTFSWKERRSCEFVITNKGKTPFVIYDMIPSCGCVKVEYDKEPISKKREMKLFVTYEPEKAGYFNKTIKIYCNIYNSPLILSIEGNAK